MAEQQIVKQEKKEWFPLRVTYSRELKVKTALDELRISCFVPMKVEKRVIDGVVKYNKTAAIHNLIFVYESREVVDEIKLKFSTELRYIMDNATKKPIVVPKRQMDDFISIVAAEEEQIMFLSLEESSLKKGDRVRIISGVFKGIEGRYVRIKRGLRVVVELNNLFAVATASLHPSMVEKIL